MGAHDYEPDRNESFTGTNEHRVRTNESYAKGGFEPMRQIGNAFDEFCKATDDTFGKRRGDMKDRENNAERNDDKQDRVNHPSHYTSGKVECIDAIESATINLRGIEAVCTANIIKYVWRWKQKNGTEDLRKAQWYLERLIASQTETDNSCSVVRSGSGKSVIGKTESAH